MYILIILVAVFLFKDKIKSFAGITANSAEIKEETDKGKTKTVIKTESGIKAEIKADALDALVNPTKPQIIGVAPLVDPKKGAQIKPEFELKA